MPIERECPGQTILSKALLGCLPEAESAVVEQHLQSCDACLQATQALQASDTWVEAIRQQPKIAQEQEAMAPMIQAVKERLRNGKVKHGDTTDVGTFRFSDSGEVTNHDSFGDPLKLLRPSEGADELGRLGPFRVLRALGKGGMGVVFEAEDIQLRRRVALKVLRPDTNSSAVAEERFMREAQTAAAVRHDHIVTIYQVGRDGKVPFIAMELLEGESLEDRLKRDGRLSLAETLRIGREIAEGLAEAHEHGLLHRDIKPANIWIERRRSRAKILDFGLARPVVTEAHLTQQGTLIGTPSYMAPEQTDTAAIDQRADLFSLGGVLYRACTGQLPFRGSNTLAVLTALATTTPTSPHTLDPTIPADVSDYIMRLLAKDPAKRPANAAEVAADLERLQAKFAAAPSTATTTAAAPPHRRTPKWQLAAAAAGAMFVLAGVIAIIRDKDGNEVARVKVPDGGRVDTVPDNAPTAPTKPNAPPSSSPAPANPGGKPITTLNDPAFQQWMKEVAAMPAEKQVEAVVKKLQELNPGYDGNNRPAIDHGVVISLRIFSDDLADISPVRALEGLKILACGGAGRPVGSGKLVDLSPLRGLPLERLECGNNKISDISSVRGMRLSWFSCSSTSVVDLSPLQGMKLTHLHIGGTKVTDLKPLRGMPLTFLGAYSSSISDLSPLQGMPLVEFACNNTFVSDASPLMSMPTLRALDVRATRLTKADVNKLKAALPDCKIDSENPTKPIASASASPLTLAKPNKTLSYPAFQQWMKDVATMPAAQQVDAVVKKLQDLNPGYDGQKTQKIENGVVTRFRFDSKDVTDISPIRALTGLKEFGCGGSTKSQLSDLSPLTGLPLEILGCSNSHVADLTPLRGIRLTVLDCGATSVADLSPLEGMPLVTLGLSYSDYVHDLSPLRGMALTRLSCYQTNVYDLSPLRGMPLATLICSKTRVYDLSPLHDCKSLTSLTVWATERPTSSNRVTLADVAELQKALPQCKIDWTDPSNPGAAQPVTPVVSNKPITTFNDPAFQQWMKEVAALPAIQQVDAVMKRLAELNPGFDGKRTEKIVAGVVTELTFSTDAITDLSPVRALTGMKILNCSGSPSKGQLCDLSPLQGMALKSLSFDNSQVSDLSPLKGMPLTTFTCGSTRVVDLSPLQGMPLSHLSCELTNISDLSPLKGMLLTYLACSGTNISDLSPLRGMPLDRLSCRSTNASNLSPLQGMPLRNLSCSNSRVTDLSPIRGMRLQILDCSSLATIDFSSMRTLTNLKSLDLKLMKASAGDVAALQESLPNCKIEWDGPGISIEGPIVSASVSSKQNATLSDPAFQQWMMDVAAMPAAKQVDAVVKKLQELNPGYDGQKTQKIEKGLITHFGFASPYVRDISPVRALVGLKSVSFNGVSGTSKGQLSDLSSLQGLSLTYFVCVNSKVADISPLREMPLTYLNCSTSNVADLSPLAGMPLASLDLTYTRVHDLSALQGMALTYLSCHSTNVYDLSPLRGMPLEQLDLVESKVYDLSPLHDCKSLVSLKCKQVNFARITPVGVAALQNALPNCKIEWGDRDTQSSASIASPKPISTFNSPAFQRWVKEVAALPADQQVAAVIKKLQELNPAFDGKKTEKIVAGVVTELTFVSNEVTDLSPIRALTGLQVLNCNGSSRPGRLYDLSPLQGMSLKSLNCSNSQISDLSPLKGMLLTTLSCGATNVFDLSPLKGMALTNLNCELTNVSDLSSLRRMELTNLNCTNTNVSDLTPLHGMPLNNLAFSGTSVSDLVTIKEMPLTILNCSRTFVSDLSPLNGMSLTKLHCYQNMVSDLSAIRGMPLTTLDVRDMTLPDVSTLHTLVKLKSLNLRGAKVAVADIAALQKTLPNCKIDWDDPAQVKTPESASPDTK